MKKLIISGLFLLLAAGCGYAPLDFGATNNTAQPLQQLNNILGNQADYQNRRIEEHTKFYDLVVNYPEFSLTNKDQQEKINLEVKNKIDSLINNFKQGIAADDSVVPAELLSMLEINYSLDNLDNELISLRFDVYNYFAGAAHGFEGVETFNYDLKKNQEIKLMDVFRADTKFLEKFSALATEYFEPKFAEGYFHPEGVEPRMENFSDFTLTKNKIIFYFGEYAIAPYAEGRQEFSIALQDLRDYLFSDYLPSEQDEVLANNGWETYEDSEFDFSFNYPANYIFNDQDEIYMFLVTNPLLDVALPESEFKGTNLLEAQFVAAATDEEETVAICNDQQANEESLPAQRINDQAFNVFLQKDAGAGNFYESTIYRAAVNDVCYELTLLLHSGNIGNYEPGIVTEFDHGKYQSQLKEILNTFKIGE